MVDMEGHDPLLTRREVADAFGVNSKTIARWVRDGKITEILTPGGYPRYRAAEVRVLLSFPPDDRPGSTAPTVTPPPAGPVPTQKEHKQ